MPSRTALLSLDLQAIILEMYTKDTAFLDRVISVQAQCRRAHLHMIHVGMGYRPGVPEINPNHPSIEAIRQLTATDKLSFHEAVAPRHDEIVVTKRRIGAFSGTDLDIILRAQEVDTLILLGIATSGAVLSTLLQAVDLSYRMTVIADCCTDLDEEVHVCLTQKVFPAAPLTRVINSSELSGELKSS